MSFGKANRFNYKIPDIIPSPADYNLSSTFTKGCSMSKNSRFSYRTSDSDDSQGICSRTIRCESQDIRCSTPNSEDEYVNTNLKSIKEKISALNQSDQRRKTFRNKSQSCENKKSHQSPSIANIQKDRVKTMVGKFESDAKEKKDKSQANKKSSFFKNISEPLLEFIDDDYYSLSSSEENYMKKVEEYELDQVCKALEKIQRRESSQNLNRIHCSEKCHEENFEGEVLNKLENIERQLKSFGNEINYLNRKLISSTNEKEIAVVTENDRKNDSSESNGKEVESETSIINSSELPTAEKVKNNNHQFNSELDKIISEAIKKLNDRFEDNRKSLISENADKIAKILDEIVSSSEKSAKNLEESCSIIAANLTERISEIFAEEKDNRTVGNQQNDESEDNDGLIHFEKSYKTLCDNLEKALREKDVLESETIGVTASFLEATKETVTLQADQIRILNEKLAMFKKFVFYKREINETPF